MVQSGSKLQNSPTNGKSSNATSEDTMGERGGHKSADYFRDVLKLNATGKNPKQLLLDKDITKEQCAKLFGQPANKNGYFYMGCTDKSMIPKIEDLWSKVHGYDCKPTGGIIANLMARGIVYEKRTGQKLNWAAYAAWTAKQQERMKEHREAKDPGSTNSKPKLGVCELKDRLRKTPGRGKEGLKQTPEQVIVEMERKKHEQEYVATALASLQELHDLKYEEMCGAKEELERLKKGKLDLMEKTRTVRVQMEDRQWCLAECRNKIADLEAKLTHEGATIRAGEETLMQKGEESVGLLNCGKGRQSEMQRELDQKKSIEAEFWLNADKTEKEFNALCDAGDQEDRDIRVAENVVDVADTERSLIQDQIEALTNGDKGLVIYPMPICHPQVIKDSTSIKDFLKVSPCPVCHKGFHCWDMVVASCKHTYHPACMASHMKTSNRCRDFSCSEIMHPDWCSSFGFRILDPEVQALAEKLRVVELRQRWMSKQLHEARVRNTQVPGVIADDGFIDANKRRPGPPSQATTNYSAFTTNYSGGQSGHGGSAVNQNFPRTPSSSTLQMSPLGLSRPGIVAPIVGDTLNPEVDVTPDTIMQEVSASGKGYVKKFLIPGSPPKKIHGSPLQAAFVPEIVTTHTLQSTHEDVVDLTIPSTVVPPYVDVKVERDGAQNTGHVATLSSDSELGSQGFETDAGADSQSDSDTVVLHSTIGGGPSQVSDPIFHVTPPVATSLVAPPISIPAIPAQLDGGSPLPMVVYVPHALATTPQVLGPVLNPPAVALVSPHVQATGKRKRERKRSRKALSAEYAKKPTTRADSKVSIDKDMDKCPGESTPSSKRVVVHKPLDTNEDNDLSHHDKSNSIPRDGVVKAARGPVVKSLNTVKTPPNLTTRGPVVKSLNTVKTPPNLKMDAGSSGAGPKKKKRKHIN